jgi:hypothetical protein
MKFAGYVEKQEQKGISGLNQFLKGFFFCQTILAGY